MFSSALTLYSSDHNGASGVGIAVYFFMTMVKSCLWSQAVHSLALWPSTPTDILKDASSVDTGSVLVRGSGENTSPMRVAS